MLRSWFSITRLNAIEFLSAVIGYNVYGVMYSWEEDIISPSLIFDFLPESPIPVPPELYYPNYWSDFPADYHIEETIGDTSYAIAADNKGGLKMWEYDAEEVMILANSGWGGTVTSDGSLIYHGPRSDPRSEITILVPFGYSIQGLDPDDTLNVIQSQVFDSGNWERNDAFDRQYYEIIYNTDADPKIVIQEVTWDTDTEAPCVKTHWYDEHYHRYGIKEFADYWYQATSQIAAVHKYAPMPVFLGARGIQYRASEWVRNLDIIKTKYGAESTEFDKFRDPNQLP